MLGCDLVLVRRSPLGWRCLSPESAQALQAALLAELDDPNWLFEQCRRIAGALAKNEIALAQIFGLRIPMPDLDAGALRRLSVAATLIKANFDPNQPRLPAGQPGGGEWTGDGGSSGGDDGVLALVPV